MTIFPSGNSIAAALLGLVLLGMGNMLSTVVMSSFVADKFGNKEYSSIMGYINIAFTLGVSLGPLIAGGVFDHFQSYRPAYFLFTVFIVCATCLMLVADRNIAKCRVKMGIEL